MPGPSPRFTHFTHAAQIQPVLQPQLNRPAHRHILLLSRHPPAPQVRRCVRLPLQRAPPVDSRDILRMYVSAIHHLGSLYSEMNNAEMAYKVLHKAAAMRPDRKDISCSLFMAQRRYGIWNVRAAASTTSSSLLIPSIVSASGVRRNGRPCC